MTTEPHPHEEQESLWWLTASPLVWSAHLLLSYGTAAVWCAKVAPGGGSLGAARWAIVAYTVVALALIAAVGSHGLRRHRYGDASLPHDFDSPADRHRFLGFATLLLSGLSAVAVAYQVLPALFIGTCR
jgi:hypothetical protein